MKGWNFFLAIFQIVIGVAAIISYIIIAVAGEPLIRWTITLILAVLFVVIGVIGLIDCIKTNKNK